MSVSPIRPRFLAFMAVVVCAVLACAGVSRAEDGPFRVLAGSWAGSGNIAVADGANERIRCQADYRVGSTGATVTLQLRCASDSYKFELHGNVRYQNGEVLGDWSEKTRGAAGQVKGRIKGDQVDVRVDGQTFSALLSLTTRGDKQAISITAPMGSQMSEANITLNRRG
jgi:hypothetical protein